MHKLLRRALPAVSDEAWQHSRVRKTLWPPQAGTKRWRAQFGAELVCVRYRQSGDGRYRFTTLEFVVDHGPVQGRDSARRLTAQLCVGRYSMRWRQALLAAGARWDETLGVWRLSREMARAVGVLRHPGYREGGDEV